MQINKEKKNTKDEVWGIPLALLFISFAWCPKIFKIVIEPAADQPPPGLNDLSTNQASVVELRGVSVTLPRGETILDVATHSKSARGKAEIITSLWKLLLIPFVSALFCNLYGMADLSKLSNGFDNFNADCPAFPYFMVQILTSFVGYMLGILACAMCMQFLAFALPMVLATPVSIVLTLIKHSPNNDVLHFQPGDPSDDVLYIIGACFLLAQFFSVGYYVFKGQDFIMAKESSLFWMPAYNGKIIFS